MKIEVTKKQNESIQVTEDWLEKEAADIVKNNIPNYDYVPDFIKSLRKLPIGNFVSFPAEIARTGANIVQRALREINTTYKVGGRTIKPFRRHRLYKIVWIHNHSCSGSLCNSKNVPNDL